MAAKKQSSKISNLINNPFALDVQRGLSKTPKKIASKYLYDEKGSDLFNQITRHPDYYLTRCELEIIEQNKGKLSDLMQNTPFKLIELGPGEGIKSLVLIQEFLKDSRQFSYYIIDISEQYLHRLSTKFMTILPTLKLKTMDKEFNEGLHELHLHSKTKNLVLFLGSSIGNFDIKETHHFLRAVRNDLKPGDYFLIGFDLRKKIDVLYHAYQDSSDLTQAFNLNLLTRMNKELGTNFNLKQFTHYPMYNACAYAMESYLISLEEQEVYSKYLDQSFFFDAFEPIQVECSYKYSLRQIKHFAKDTGFKLVENFQDEKKYFTLSLWQSV